jgi:hypothetical protein
MCAWQIANSVSGSNGWPATSLASLVTHSVAWGPLRQRLSQAPACKLPGGCVRRAVEADGFVAIMLL